ncbi:uncharacterized protein [Bemisia tabaci]|uniref:uncharacterized protein isoform X1 n=1 Tax=Bemisia tabaci TaxID=7038 RepID=UPI003B27E257
MEAKRMVEEDLIFYVKAQKTKSCIDHTIQEDIAKLRLQDDRLRCMTADTVVAERGLSMRNRLEDTDLPAEKIARRLEQTVLEGVGVTMVKTMRESFEVANEARTSVENEVMNQLEVWRRQIERTVEENTEHQRMHYAELTEGLAKMGNKITQVVACEEAREKNRVTEVKEIEKLKEAIVKKEGIIKDMAATKAESSEKQRKQAVKDIEKQMEKMEKTQRETREELGKLMERIEGIKWRPRSYRVLAIAGDNRDFVVFETKENLYSMFAKLTRTIQFLTRKKPCNFHPQDVLISACVQKKK